VNSTWSRRCRKSRWSFSEVWNLWDDKYERRVHFCKPWKRVGIWIYLHLLFAPDEVRRTRRIRRLSEFRAEDSFWKPFWGSEFNFSGNKLFTSELVRQVYQVSALETGCYVVDLLSGFDCLALTFITCITISCPGSCTWFCCCIYAFLRLRFYSKKVWSSRSNNLYDRFDWGWEI
jgi:hypothetical protein